MKIEIPSPRNFENYHGSSAAVRAFLDDVEQSVGEACDGCAINTLRISLLIAHPDDIAIGKFAEYMRFDWKLGYAAVGVQGDYNRYLEGDDREKIAVIGQMLPNAYLRIAGRRKSKFNSKLAFEVTNSILEKHLHTGYQNQEATI